MVDRCFGQLRKSPEEFADLSGFDFELEIVGSVLQGATAALTIDRALRSHTARRGFKNPNHLALGVVFLFLYDPDENSFAGQGSVHKANAPVRKSAHARASVADAFDGDWDFRRIHGE